MQETELKLWDDIAQAITRAEDAGLENKAVLGVMIGFTSRIIGVSFATTKDLDDALPIMTGAMAKEARDYFASRQPREGQP